MNKISKNQLLSDREKENMLYDLNKTRHTDAKTSGEGGHQENPERGVEKNANIQRPWKIYSDQSELASQSSVCRDVLPNTRASPWSETITQCSIGTEDTQPTHF
jgi:hypothetical protein